jgi:predicted RNA binding protein YcfA (HicA-like mRNA interferase family)
MVAAEQTRIILKELTRAGWTHKRAGKGSHAVWQCPSSRHTVTVPRDTAQSGPVWSGPSARPLPTATAERRPNMAYEVHVTGREGRWWAVEIPELNGVTQAARLADVEAEARDYIAVTLDVAPSTVDVRVIMDDTPHARRVQERSERIRAARAQADAIEAEAARETADLVHELAQDGVPTRDIATLVGVSFQRVSQLANA